MSKDRAAPFSRKHRKYWMTITGGMILIGAINLGIGFCSYDPPTGDPEPIELVIPRSQYARDGGVAPDTIPDAAEPPDAAATTPGDATPAR